MPNYVFHVEITTLTNQTINIEADSVIDAYNEVPKLINVDDSTTFISNIEPDSYGLSIEDKRLLDTVEKSKDAYVKDEEPDLKTLVRHFSATIKDNLSAFAPYELAELYEDLDVKNALEIINQIVDPKES